MSQPSEFSRICELDDVWEGEMHVFEVDGQEVLIVHAPDGEVRAYDSVCPHQNHPLGEGELIGCILTCSAHLWQFDVISGNGVNPVDVRLNAYPVKIKNNVIYVAMPTKN